jgi:DNA-binding transcriptional regulator YdaS (Cro superfamily)
MEAKQLKSLIDDRGMKKKFVAGKLNVSGALISQWIKGEKPIAARHIPDLNKIFYSATNS